MQTFLPYPNFRESAKVLDNKRLGKQRVEAYQILKTLNLGPLRADGSKTPWFNHPAVRQWAGHEIGLAAYGRIICEEWIKRGHQDSLRPKLLAYEWGPNRTAARESGPLVPDWIGDERYHASHRSNLLRKFPEHYEQFGWTEGPDMPYFWPSHNGY